MYINTQTLDVLSEQEIRALNPNTSYPVPFVEPEGYAYVFPSPQPLHDPVTQRVQQIAPVLTNKGHWEQRWLIIDKTPQLITEEAEARRIAAIPLSVSPRQIRQALTRAGYRGAVEAAVAGGSQDIKDWYEFSNTFERYNTVSNEFAATLGFTPRQLDDLWTLASTL